MDKAAASQILTALRAGQAPREGAEHLAVGLASFWKPIEEGVIDLALRGNSGAILYVMGEYGRGKTMFCNFSRGQLAKKGQGFVWSYIDLGNFEQLSDFLGLYRLIVDNLMIPSHAEPGLKTLLEEFVESTRSDASFDRFRRETIVDVAVLEKLFLYRKHRNFGNDTGAQTAIEWMRAKRHIPATQLHLIGEKGFSKLEAEDIDHYLAAIKTIAVWLGYEGLLIQIDEAEDRRAGFSDDVVRDIFRNLKRVHNNLFQKQTFSRIIFLLAGTRDLYHAYESLDEAQRQRMRILNYDLPILNEPQYNELARKVIAVYDQAFDTHLRDRIDESEIEALVGKVAAKGGSLDQVTPRDFLFTFPSQSEALFNRLESMRMDKGLGLLA